MTQEKVSTKQYTGILKEVTYSRQSRDAFDRLSFQVGETITHAGKKAWTDHHFYCDPPTMNHPLNLKLFCYNKNGKCLTTFQSIDEFRQWHASIGNWLAEHDQELRDLEEKNYILKRNKNYLRYCEQSLSDHHMKTPPEITIDGELITEKTIYREKELIMKMINVLPNSEHKSFLIKDICKRIDDLILQDIDCSDINEMLATKTLELNQ